MVSFQDSTGFHFCGGSLIAPNVVLTAAHCTDGISNPGDYRVEIGRHSIITGDAVGESIAVASIIESSCYDSSTTSSDVAVLILESNSTYTPVEYLGKKDSAFADTTNLPMVGDLAEVMGWGALSASDGPLDDCYDASEIAGASVGVCFEHCLSLYPDSLYAVDFASGCCCQTSCDYFYGSGYETAVVAGGAVPENSYATTLGESCPSETEDCEYDLYSDAGWCSEYTSSDSPDNLMTVSVPVWDQDACNVAYDGGIDDSMLCAGYDDLRKDSCQGDSGGPLYMPGTDGSEDVLVGVVSWGYGCADGYPGVYARVSEFTDFLDLVAVDGDTEVDAGKTCMNSEGSCFSGDATVSTLNAATHRVNSVLIRDLKVGDQVLSVDKASGKQTYVPVVALPHSPNSHDFVEIRTHAKQHKAAAATTSGGTEKLLATEHHTFPLCGSGSSSGSTGGLRKEVAAKDLKPGDCLLAAGGVKTSVASVKRVGAHQPASSDTYTIVLPGRQDLVLVGGVVSHAKPSKAPSAAAKAVSGSGKKFKHSVQEQHSRKSGHGPAVKKVSEKKKTA